MTENHFSGRLGLASSSLHDRESLLAAKVTAHEASVENISDDRAGVFGWLSQSRNFSEI
jgi:hypothetical protein